MKTIRRHKNPTLVRSLPLDSLRNDPANPRISDPARMDLLRLSLRKLGMVQPLLATTDGMLLSGHQRRGVAIDIGFKTAPVIVVDMTEERLRGFNLSANRTSNDFSSFDTGSTAAGKLNLDEVLEAAEALPDFKGENWWALNCKPEPLAPLVVGQARRYDKKAAVMALIPYRMGVKIPVVASVSGKIVNGIHRAFAALEAGETHWPVIRIPDTHAEVAGDFLNHLSMNFHVDEDFARLLRSSAYRRPHTGSSSLLPKSYRYWANGERMLQEKDSYSVEYWRKFRDLHGSVLDFGGGLCKAAPFLRGKGIEATSFEPYMIDPDATTNVGVPSPEYSRKQARRFLGEISDPKRRFDSIFLSSVVNSVPFARDRLCVLAVVHALCSRTTVVYGTFRNMVDFDNQYIGLRTPRVFTFDSEPGVHLGDFAFRPKIQKHHTEEEARDMFGKFWKDIALSPEGHVTFFRLRAPVGVNLKVLATALELEFDLPYRSGETMNLVKEARVAFEKRLMVKLP